MTQTQWHTLSEHQTHAEALSAMETWQAQAERVAAALNAQRPGVPPAQPDAYRVVRSASPQTGTLHPVYLITTAATVRKPWARRDGAAHWMLVGWADYSTLKPQPVISAQVQASTADEAWRYAAELFPGAVATAVDRNWLTFERYQPCALPISAPTWLVQREG